MVLVGCGRVIVVAVAIVIAVVVVGVVVVAVAGGRVDRCRRGGGHLTVVKVVSLCCGARGIYAGWGPDVVGVVWCFLLAFLMMVFCTFFFLKGWM